jgi:hypothetical protein
MVLAELEERGVGSNLDIGQVLVKNFNWLLFTPPPPLVALSGPSTINVCVLKTQRIVWIMMVIEEGSTKAWP